MENDQGQLRRVDRNPLLETIRNINFIDIGHKDNAETKKKVLKLIENCPCDDLNMRDNWGYTPLIHTLCAEDIEILKKLLRYGADPSLTVQADQDKYKENGYTPLEIMAEETSEKAKTIFKLLLQHKTNINQTMRSGKTLYLSSECTKENKELLEMERKKNTCISAVIMCMYRKYYYKNVRDYLVAALKKYL